MFKLLCFFFGILFLFTVEITYAIPAKPLVKHAKRALYVDSTAIKAHTFNDTALQKYAQQAEFKYDDLPPKGLSLWDRIWRWIWHIIADIFYKIKGDNSTWFLFKTALITMAACAIVFIIFKLAGIDIFKLLRGESKHIEIPYGESLENIHDISFDSEIEKAITNRNYRLAVRLLYLRCLKQLNDAQLIHWQIEKTNSNYLSELGDTEYRHLFSMLTTQFEYIWYGDFPVDGQSFQNINALFIDFKKGLP